MDAIHLVRVLLFWDSEIARYVYSPYFTGVLRKSWTLPTNRMISHAELVKRNIELSRYGSQSLDMNNDNEMRYLWTIVPNLVKGKDSYTRVEFTWIQQQTVSSTQDINTINMTKHVTVITQMVSHEPSMLYTTVNDDEMKLTIRMKIMSHLVNLNQTITMMQRKKSYKFP
ncbi:hypothetical protein M9H77_07282 [Catharanthus roseus]|uniref:Uncharacterized protein n=1 Tax=Catharanthus roseus TaxID=4058 RepID=A0ACC0BUR4_CATRO|nr:hypothetical protein M9H77_07282 [Catharanthus roseus]